MKRVPITRNAGPRVAPSYRVRDGIDDSLQNLLSGLGTSKDKTTNTTFVYHELGKPQLEAAFRSDWIARKAICIPAQDATRQWRTWQGDKDTNQAMETAEQDLSLQTKVKSAMIKARLYGGAGLLMGVDQGTLDKPLIIENVKEGQLKFIHVVSKWELSSGPIDWDPASETYGQPTYYNRAGGASGMQIHPSRVVRFLGNEVPDIQLSNGWGDSILQSINDAIIAAGMTCQNGAQLLNEIKMDVVRIPGLTQSLANKKYAQLLTDRFGLASVTKSLYNILLLDKEEEWQRIVANMTGIPDVLKMYLLIVSAAADIPATRMLSQSPAGLSATGDSDTRNYYDHVKSEQTTTTTPALRALDEILIRSTLGTSQPDDINYSWNSLWQLDEVQKSSMIKQKADSYKVDFDTGLLPSEVLRDARINQLKHDDVYPGLEQILTDYGPLEPIDDDPEPGSVIGPDGKPIAPTDPKHPDNQAPAPKLGPDGKPLPVDPAAAKPATPIGDMVKRIRRANMRNRKYQHMDGVTRTLYMYRSVLNTSELIDWAKTAGIPKLVAPNELHVTIMYSQTPVDWSKTGEAWGQDDKGNLTVTPGGMRALQKFGNAIVLCFNSSNLSYRHCDIKETTGATWQYAEYQPHVTLAYLENDDAPWSESDLAALGAYRGAIELGPEVFAEASNPYVRDSNGNPYWALDMNENHDPDGRFGSGSSSSPANGKNTEKAGAIARARDAVKQLMTKEGAKAAVKAGLGKLNENKAALANAAIQGTLYHGVGIDYGPDIEKAIGHEIEHFAHNASIGLSMAKDLLTKGVQALKSYMNKPPAKKKAADHLVDADDHNAAILKAIDNVLRALEAYAPVE